MFYVKHNNLFTSDSDEIYEAIMSSAGYAMQEVLLDLQEKYKFCDYILDMTPIMSTLGRQLVINPRRSLDSNSSFENTKPAKIVNNGGLAMIICMTEGRKGMRDNGDLSQQELLDIKHTLKVHFRMQVVIVMLCD